MTKVAECQIHTQNQVVILYTNSTLSEREIKEIPFTIASKTIEYLGMNLTKEIQDLNTENDKTLLKEVNEYLNTSQ